MVGRKGTVGARMLALVFLSWVSDMRNIFLYGDMPWVPIALDSDSLNRARHISLSSLS